MITSIRYQCEICLTFYGSSSEAEGCESQGYGPPLPIGLIFGYALHGPSSYVTLAVKNNRRGHRNHPHFWATRDGYNGGTHDTLGSESCGGGIEVLYACHKTDRDNPQYQRMVDYLRSVEIEPTYWDGEQVVAIERLERTEA